MKKIIAITLVSLFIGCDNPQIKNYTIDTNSSATNPALPVPNGSDGASYRMLDNSCKLFDVSIQSYTKAIGQGWRLATSDALQLCCKKEKRNLGYSDAEIVGGYVGVPKVPSWYWNVIEDERHRNPPLGHDINIVCAL